MGAFEGAREMIRVAVAHGVAGRLHQRARTPQQLRRVVYAQPNEKLRGGLSRVSTEEAREIFGGEVALPRRGTEAFGRQIVFQKVVAAALESGPRLPIGTGSGFAFRPNALEERTQEQTGQTCAVRGPQSRAAQQLFVEIGRRTGVGHAPYAASVEARSAQQRGRWRSAKVGEIFSMRALAPGPDPAWCLRAVG